MGLLELTPLDEANLPPAVRRVVAAGAPPQVQMMTARGVAPLPPLELVLALYQLSRPLVDEAVRQAAEKTAGELPDAVLAGALVQPLDGRVLGFFGLRLVGRRPLLEKVLANRATTDETYVDLAVVVRDEGVLEIIAQNEERLLRAPAIIAALYKNPRTRLSTAIRAVELAIRNGVHVDGVPAFEELCAAISADAAAGAKLSDAAFEAAVVVAQTADATGAVLGKAAAAAEGEGEGGEPGEGKDDEAPDDEKAVAIKDLPNAAKVRLASLGNSYTRAILIRDKSRVVAMAVIRSPTMTESEVVRYASNRDIHEDVVRYIAQNREWIRLYPVKLGLVFNPKTPMQQAIKFIPHLMPKDLRTLSRSKSVPSAVAKVAQGLMATRKQ